ncbi:MAG: MotA/TolQ/ExbB proton channel family protein [Clostridia bacterium]|nr:MotA/TolQ/ExbB proton channel family protein [Clostridia bacterium]
MMEFIRIIRSIFSLDALIYLAIVFVLFTAIVRCILPLSAMARRLRRAARVIITENKQNKEKKSWNDLNFLGDKLQGTWADFLQNAELRDAHGESCDVSQYINEDTVIYAFGGIGLADITPGMLTSLGILGTFLGLVMGLSGLNLNAADTSALLAAMEKLIGGMSTAFLTSIAGVLASIFFNLLNNHYTSKCQKAIDRFCEVFSLYAMPKPVSQDSAMLALQQEQTAYIRQAVEDMSQKMAVQMEQSIMRAMLPVQRSMDNFILAATQAQVEGVDRIATVFVQRMNAALGNEFEHLRQVLMEAGRDQLQSQQEMRAATEAIGQMTQDVINMHQLSQGVLEHFRDYVTDMNASRAQVDDTNRRTIELLEAMNKTSGQQAMYLSKLQDYQAALAANTQQYGVWMDQFLVNAREQTNLTSAEMERVASELRESARTLESGSEQFARKTQESLAKTTALFDESVTTSIHELNDMLANMRETTRIMPQLLSQSRDRYAEQVDQFVTALVRLQKSMEKLGNAADAAAGKGKE